MSDNRITLNIPGTGVEVFFQKPSHPNPVYEIEIVGVLDYNVFDLMFWGGRLPADPARCDAFYRANESGRFNTPHEWLVVNSKPLSFRSNCSYGYRLAQPIELERGAHRYRFRINDPGEAVGIAVDPAGFLEKREYVSDGHLTATVGTLPAGTPFLKRKLDRIHKVEQSDPELTRDVERAAAFEKRLVAAARREEEALAKIDAMEIVEDNKRHYREVVRDFYAEEIQRISKKDQGGSTDVEKI